MPFWFLVRSLNCWTNCPMFTPCWPSAGPTGGAGVATPPDTCSRICAVTTFAITGNPSVACRQARSGRPEEREPPRPAPARFSACAGGLGGHASGGPRACSKSSRGPGDGSFASLSPGPRDRFSGSLLHLPVFQFDRHGPAEDRQLDADGTLRLEDLLDLPFHPGKRTVADAHAVAAVELRLGRDL